ncbi:M48 family metallopeptidase [Candidatus Entotheonella palauensis]|uniref:M48 family metallopeptidase n=1 Tax=Candidatus Entotheonella palauensis TaxID=93172 RepID=UPI000B7E49D0|nr:M48 family metallopeptidase [Candidatus Entotheonella palauensis]
MDITTLRAQGDRELTQELLNHTLVKRVIRDLNENDTPLGVRRQLLATAVRLTRGMSPPLYGIVDECREVLSITMPMEIYVYASAQLNAMCIKPEEGRLFLAFTSSLIEKFSLPELKFVLGHELGHFVFQHHDIPIGYILKGRVKPDPNVVLKLFAWSRYAEISADRAGAVCSRDLDAVAGSMFKLASGLTSPLVKASMDDFLSQLEDMQVVDDTPGRGAASQDWFSTHPFSPLRLQALKYAFESELLRDGGYSVAELEAHVEPLMGLMKQSYLEEKSPSAEAMRRVLFAGAIVIADVCGGISAEEKKVIESYFGQGALSPVLDLERLKATLSERISDAVKQVGPAKRAQVFRDLVLVARADEHVSPAERAELNHIGHGLELGEGMIMQLMEQHVELD